MVRLRVLLFKEEGCGVGGRMSRAKGGYEYSQVRVVAVTGGRMR